MIPVAVALTCCAAFYLHIGWRESRRMHALHDMLPIAEVGRATCTSGAEFSASTVATTISLATVLMAIFELASYFGIWLLWTALTTATGLLIVRLFAARIWTRLQAYNGKLPTLHEFLATEYNTPALARIGALCTSLGFLGALAVEFSVGARLFAQLMPAIPEMLVVGVIACIVIIYVCVGGFRAVIRTDRIQMLCVWLLLLMIAGFYLWVATSKQTHSGLSGIALSLADVSWRDGLAPFLVGIFIINVPTYLSDMATWQRIASVRDQHALKTGLGRSVAVVFVSWGAIVLLACALPTFLASTEDTNPLVYLVGWISRLGGFWPTCVATVMIAGLLAALMSTASTQLIAVTHTVCRDLFYPGESLRDRKREVLRSRVILVVAAAVALIAVEVLIRAGFSIADLVFAIYGAQLGLFPPVLASLLCGRRCLAKYGGWAGAAISVGFVAGWASAFWGKATGDANLVFLAPGASLGTSVIVFAPAWVAIVRKKARGEGSA